MRKLFAAGLVVVTLAVTLLFAHSRAFGQPAKPADPIFGRWMMDQTKSVNNRRGDHATYPTQHMRILAADGGGLLLRGELQLDVLEELVHVTIADA